MNKQKHIILCTLFSIFLIILSILSLSIGYSSIGIFDILDIFFKNTENVERDAILMSRLSRTLISILVGSGLAIAGLLIQSLTNNPMASPSLLGINSGAIFFIVFALVVFNIQSMEILIIFAFIGATLTATLVLLISSLNKQFGSPLRLVLAGSAISALFMSFTQGFLILNESNLDTVLFWIGGSSVSRDIFDLQTLALVMFVAICIPFFLTSQMTLLRYGEELSVALGQNVIKVKIVMVILIIILTSCAVAMAGSIGFVGLVVPHIARAVAKHNYRYSVIYSILIGALLVLAADIIARVVISPSELPLGAITTLIGIPFLINILRKRVYTI